MLRIEGNLLWITSFILGTGLIATSSFAAVPETESQEVAEPSVKTHFHLADVSSRGVAKRNLLTEAEVAILDAGLNASALFAAHPETKSQEVAEPWIKIHFHSAAISSGGRAKGSPSTEVEAAVEQESHSSKKNTLSSSSTNSSRIAQRKQEGNKSSAFSSPLPTVEPLSVDASSEPDVMEQVTSVSQLRDVQPTDWAFEALQVIVERYGCIEGYPDRTYRGNRAMTRYEFAAGLNVCLDKINQLIAASTANFVRKEDLLALQKLQQEFATEIATLGGRVNALEAHTTRLEQGLFSTTTKLTGEVIFALADVFGGDGYRNHTFLQERVFINFLTSFTGKDQLFVSLAGGNVPITTSAFNLPGVNLGGSLPYPSGEGALTHQVGSTTNNLVYLYYLEYRFPISDRLQVILPLYNGTTYYIAPVLNPYIGGLDYGTGALSAFGQQSPIYRLGAGQGIGVNYKLINQVTLTGVYLADGLNANSPTGGAFQSGYTAFGQITWNPSKNFGLGLSYVNSYFRPGVFGFNNYGLLQLTGTAVANTLAGQTNLSLISQPEQPVIMNSYGVEFSFQPSPKFAINGWFGAGYPRLIGRGDGEILYYALTLAFPDFGKQGNLLGFVVGAEPYLTRFNGGNPQPFKTDIPFHIEAFYQYQLTPNIALTPGFIWLTAPNQDKANDDDVIATLRATFSF